MKTSADLCALMAAGVLQYGTKQTLNHYTTVAAVWKSRHGTIHASLKTGGLATDTGALQNPHVSLYSNKVTCHKLVWLFPQTQKTAFENHRWIQAELCKQLMVYLDLQHI